MTFYVYVLKSRTTGKIYIGQTSDLDTRLKRHNQELSTKKGSYTKLNQGPWDVIYKEVYNTRSEVVKREKQLKSYQGRLFIKKLISGR